MIGALTRSLLAIRAHLVNDRRLGEEVIGDRVEVSIAQIFEAVLDRLPHRALDLALLGGGAGPQELDNVVLFPFADPGRRIRRDIGNELPVRPIRQPR